MSIEPIKAELRGLLTQTNYDIELAKRTLAYGKDRARARAASQLVALRRRKEELEARLYELDHSPDGAAVPVIQWFKDDWMVVIQRIEAWVGGRQ
jgi:hypothetical protein